MSTTDEPRRLTPTERLHEVTMATLNRRPSEPESAVEITTTTIRPAGQPAFRVHNWTVTVRDVDPGEAARVARHIDAILATQYAGELDGDDPSGEDA
jgi:hypothetical protein